MKIFNTLFLFLFVVAAALQYNDPDPYLWIPIYLYGALLCFLFLRNRYSKILYIIGLAGYIPYAVYLFFDKTGVLSWASEHEAEDIAQTMKATRPWIEETREFFGLLILIAVLATNTIWWEKRRRSGRTGTV